MDDISDRAISRASDASWINAFFITDASFTVGRE